MNKTASLGRLALGTLLIFSPLLALAGSVEQLQAFLNETQSFQAQFRQTISNRQGVQAQESWGVLSVVRPGKLRWEVSKPYPKASDSNFEKIRIGLAGKELRVMALHDNFGQVTRIYFSKHERNPKLPASLFTFTPPPGADVIGE